MAITTTTITKAAGWARTDVIDQLEQAFTWLGLHGTQITGLVTSITEYDGGGTVGSAGTDYYDVPSSTTTGIGTGATFNVYRSSGSVNQIYVNRPGYGYTDGEQVTISADDIGGSGAGAVAIGITVAVDGGATPVGYGSTNQFFDKNFTPFSDSGRPWCVLKQDFDTSKRFGVTYRGFKVYSDYQLQIMSGSSFYPYDINNTSDKGGAIRDSFRGTRLLDVVDHSTSSNVSLDYDIYTQGQFSPILDSFRYASSNSPTTHDLKLNIYRSSIDTDFAVLSYNQPSVSGSLNDSTFSTFIIHNFDSNLWDLDEVFSAGITQIICDPATSQINGDTAVLGFRTALVGNYYPNGTYLLCTRSAEAGWSQIRDQNSHYGSALQNYNIASSQTNYTNSVDVGQNSWETIRNGEATIYSRNGGLKNEGELTTSNSYFGNRYPITTYTSVIKGIPINGNLIPCPYYMPDDFVLIDFKLTQSGQDIKQGDTITISGSEVYTVITGSYNKYNETAGILFCARTV